MLARHCSNVLMKTWFLRGCENISPLYMPIFSQSLHKYAIVCLYNYILTTSVEAMACRLFVTKSLPEPMLSYRQLDPCEPTR